MHSILLFARSPEREAAAKRMPGAAPLFRAVIAAWLDAAQRHGAMALIACEPEDRAALAKIAPHVERRWIEQRGRTFGERVVRAAGEAFADSDAVIIAAIDAPPPRDLRAAFDAVQGGRVVVGPARDGGVNFIGLAHLDAALLANLTVRRCRERCTRLLVLRAVTDLDSPASVSAARNERAWRIVFESRALHHVAFAKPRVVAVRSLPPRAPPGCGSWRLAVGRGAGIGPPSCQQPTANCQPVPRANHELTEDYAMPSYYLSEDLARFGEISKANPKGWDAFLNWYQAVMAPGALDERTKKLIALAVAYSIQEPYCIDSYSSACNDAGISPEEMAEAVGVAAVIRGGGTIAHWAQSCNAMARREV